ncbi:MAG: PstS family phosphate ABC transporter substrate-binding protein [Chloroflexi bacterium]|nr:PstS family phosphate ABC transporter substrate-binding protein [Chloroflexota bacterium]
MRFGRGHTEEVQRVFAIRWRRLLPLAMLALAATMLIGACGGDDGGGETTGSGEKLSGSVAVDGSSTVFPVTEAVAEEFRSVGPDVRVTVGVSGTGGGFEKFCSAETDISNASRPIKQSEIDSCAENGIEYLPLRVGLDGLAVVAHPDAEFLECITMDELAILWGPDSEGSIKSWNQVRASWPDEEIKLFGPDTDSGTFDFFTEEVNGEGGASRADYTNSTDDNVLVTGISGSKGGAGYFGYAYYAENAERLRVVAVDGGSGCVIPSDATVSDGSYALARPLYIYVSTKSLAEKPQVREFVRYYLSDAAIALVPDVGYTAIAADELAESRANLEAAISGG